MGHCDHPVRETRRGAGPCRIEAEVRRRNGHPNWWCRTHGMAAAMPDGTALEKCPGAWLEPVPVEECLELDAQRGEIAVWGVVPPALEFGATPDEEGRVHVHRRINVQAEKDIDASFAIVTVRNGENKLVIEGMAAVAYALSLDPWTDCRSTGVLR